MLGTTCPIRTAAATAVIIHIAVTSCLQSLILNILKTEFPEVSLQVWRPKVSQDMNVMKIML